MQRILYSLLLVLFTLPAVAGERLDLTTPVPPTPGVNNYKIIALHLNWMQTADKAYIKVVLLADNGKPASHVLAQGAAARTLMNQLNKLDLSAKSLHRRVMERLIADGVIAGSISGAPD
tara:strand:+ start:407 stop:763 length:357 start_codon:yes stop_codon:yes gene_type:complete